ncbi:MAG: hypothetical protein IJT85_09000, partial [Ruminococcus sp.]|nr:hypothetical protein [Ruminococcus sp.]
MKTKFKHGSLRTLSIVLSLVILLTSIGIASLITANAYTSLTFYYKIGTGSWTSTLVNLSSNSGSVDIDLTSGTTMYSVIKMDNNEWYGNQSLEAGATRNLASLSSNYDYTSGSNSNTFTPSVSGTYTFTFDMGSKKISVSDASGGGGDEPADSSYSIAGRFKVHNSSGSDIYTSSSDNTKWSNNSTSIKFVKTEDTGIYVLHTYSTLSELSAQISENNAYFFIYDSSNNKWYQPWSGTSGSVNTVSAAYSTKYSMNQESSFHDNVGNFFMFSGSDTTKYVDIYFDTTNGYKLYYKLVDPEYFCYM